MRDDRCGPLTALTSSMDRVSIHASSTYEAVVIVGKEGEDYSLIRSQLFRVQSSQDLSYGLSVNLTGNGAQTLQATLTNGTLNNTFTVTNNFVDAAYAMANRSNIAEFYAFGLSPMSLSNLLSKLEVDPKITGLDDYMIAYSCSLYFSVQAYNVSSTAGETSQTIVGTWAQTRQVVGHPAINFTDVPRDMNPRTGPFSIFQGAQDGLVYAFAQILAGRVLQGGSTNNDALLFLQGVSDTAAPAFNSFIHAIYDASNSKASIDALVQQMATVLTNHIRGTFSAPADARYVGTLLSPSSLSACAGHGSRTRFACWWGAWGCDGVADCAEGCEGLEGEPATAPSGGSGRGGEAEGGGGDGEFGGTGEEGGGIEGGAGGRGEGGFYVAGAVR